MAQFKLQTMMENAGKWACLAIDYCYAVADYIGCSENDHSREALVIQTLVECYDTDVLFKDFYVADPVALMRKSAELAGVTIYPTVEKLDITSYADLPEKYACVRHDYNGNSHFVLAKNGIRIYDPLESSQCVKYGKPTTARIITFK